MKLLLAAAALLGLVAADCPHDLEVRCIDDINASFKVCDKAAKEKGKDIPADIECMKYLAQVEK